MPYPLYTPKRPWQKAESELRDVQRRIAQERRPYPYHSARDPSRRGAPPPAKGTGHEAALRNGFAASLHRSQIFRDLRPMQAVAAELTGYAGKFRCLLETRI
jgi:hypothetical protein